MSEAKSLTELAMRKRRDAYIERRCKNPPILSPVFEREADELMTMPEGPPDVGAGGEVVREQVSGLGGRRGSIRNTLEQGPHRIAEDASIDRTDLLMQRNLNCVALGIDAAESIGAANSLEKMLAHQLAACHEAAMRTMNRAFEHEGDSVEFCRCMNVAARLMSAYQDGLLTLQKLRTGGNQIVTVQHVNVAAGGHAVVGTVQTRGHPARGAVKENE